MELYNHFITKFAILHEICILQICSLLRGGIAERGGVRVGHRIIDINSQSVVAVPHEKIVNLLATSVGEVRMLSEHYGKLIIVIMTIIILKIPSH